MDPEGYREGEDLDQIKNKEHNAEGDKNIIAPKQNSDENYQIQIIEIQKQIRVPKKCENQEIQIEIRNEQKIMVNQQNLGPKLQAENQEQILKGKNIKVKREKRKMRNTSLYDKEQRQEVAELFIGLIDAINQCYTGINQSNENRKEDRGGEIQQNSYLNASKNQNKISQPIRRKRKIKPKQNHEQKDLARIKERKQKRLESRKNLNSQKDIDNLQIKQEDSNIEKQKQVRNLSVQEIINRKLEEKRNIEKLQILSDYSVVMKYVIDNKQEEDGLQRILNLNSVSNLLVEDKDRNIQVLARNLQRRNSGVTGNNSHSAKKLSISKCMEVSFSPNNFQKN